MKTESSGIVSRGGLDLTQKTGMAISAEDLEALNQGLESKTPQDVLEWAFKAYAPDIVMACSFGGMSGMALVDMAAKIYPRLRVFYLDTDFLFPETYALRDEVASRYSISPVGFKSRLTPEEQAVQHGEALWGRDPDLCCELRKVEPNVRALEGERAWISGIRRDQAVTRSNTPIVSWDDQFDLVKINPLATWTESQVIDYVKEYKVPYNPLYDQGYLSIGCTYCTRAVKPGDDPRAGRWAGFDKLECGIHLPGQEPADSEQIELQGSGK